MFCLELFRRPVRSSVFELRSVQLKDQVRQSFRVVDFLTFVPGVLWCRLPELKPEHRMLLGYR